jgi:hypothetical protein
MARVRVRTRVSLREINVMVSAKFRVWLGLACGL